MKTPISPFPPMAFPRLNKQARDKLGYAWTWWISDVAELVKGPILTLKHHLKKDMKYYPGEKTLLPLYRTLDEALFTPLMEFCQLVQYVKWWGQKMRFHEGYGDPLPEFTDYPRPDYPVILTGLKSLLQNTEVCLKNGPLSLQRVLQDLTATLKMCLHNLEAEDRRTRQGPQGRRPFLVVKTPLDFYLD